MEVVDQWRAFAGLIKDGWDEKMIAEVYSMKPREVKQILALSVLPKGILLKGILDAYEIEDIDADVLRLLAVSPREKQSLWVKLYKTGEYPAYGYTLKEWLYNSSQIFDTSVALFNVEILWRSWQPLLSTPGVGVPSGCGLY